MRKAPRRRFSRDTVEAFEDEPNDLALHMVVEALLGSVLPAQADTDPTRAPRPLADRLGASYTAVRTPEKVREPQRRARRLPATLVDRGRTSREQKCGVQGPAVVLRSPTPPGSAPRP